MHRSALAFVATVSFMSLACQGNGPGLAPTLPLPILPGSAGAPPAPAAPAVDGPRDVALGCHQFSGGIEETALSLWTLHLDPATLTASLTSKVSRGLQQTDDIYDLSIDNLIQPDSFRITGMSADSGDFLITYEFAHPFPAPADPTAPATAANRADLGIAGRVVFLIDTRGTGTFDFFTGDSDVTLFPGLLEDPDGYMQPRGLLTLTGFNANTFPYYTLVDETPSQSNRLTPPAPATATGNYDPNTGWQRDDFGVGNIGFTGYGILHQGQTVGQQFRVDGATLATYGETGIDVAIIAKYTDPRGGTGVIEKRANRLPGATADTAKYVYREPHGSLDCESITLVQTIGAMQINNPFSPTTVGFRVVDWDARAIETSGTDLAAEAIASHVAQNTSGAPTLAVCVPGILGDSATVMPWDTGTTLQDDDSAVAGGDVGQDSGRPGDGLFYSNQLQNMVASGQSRQTYWGVIRAVDPEDALTTDDRFTLDPNLQPVTANRPRIETFQAFPIAFANGLPTLTVSVVDSTVDSATAPALQVNNFSDFDGDVISVDIDWNNDGTYEDHQTLNPGDPDPLWTAPVALNATTTADSQHGIPVRYSDGVITSPIDITPPPIFTLGPNRPPVVAGQPSLTNDTVKEPALFNIDQSLATASDPEGDPISYQVTNNRNDDVVTSTSFPIPATFSPLTEAGPLTFQVRAIDPLHPGATGTYYPEIEGTILQGGWARAIPSSTTPFIRQVVANSDMVVVVGNRHDDIDFGNGVLPGIPTTGMFIAAYNADGSYRWSHTYNPNTYGSFNGCLILPEGYVLAVAGFVGPFDFGGGALTTEGRDGIVLLFDGNTGGIFGQNMLYTTPGANDELDHVYLDGSGGIIYTGHFSAPEDFGHGLRTPAGPWDSVIFRVDSNGDIVWDTVISGSSIDTTNSVVVSPTGPIYVGCTSLNDGNFGFGSHTTTNNVIGAVVKISGATGAPLWERVLDGSSQCFATVDPTGGLVSAAGSFIAPSLDFGGGPRPTGGAYVAQWTSGNVWQWDHLYGNDLGNGFDTITSTPTGDLLIGGLYYQNQDFGGGGRNAEDVNDGVLLHLTGAGAYRWDRTINGASSDVVWGVASDGDASCYATGLFSGRIDFDPGPGTRVFTDNFNSDAFLARYDTATGGF